MRPESGLQDINSKGKGRKTEKMRVKETAARYSHVIAAVLIIIQPVMDVASYWLTFAGVSNTVTLLIRMLVFAFALITAFSVSNRKVIYYSAVSVALLLYLGHYRSQFYLFYSLFYPFLFLNIC